MRCKAVYSVLSIAIAAVTSLSSIPASAATMILYDADPDNNIATPAPDPTSMGWGIVNTQGGTTPAATFSNPGLTTGGAPAWILNDVGQTGAAGTTAGIQNNSLYYDLDAATVAALNANGFELTITLEQLADPIAGGLVGIGVDHGGDDVFGLTVSTRFGVTPPLGAGLQTFTYSWDGTLFSTPPGTGVGTEAGDTTPFWVGPNDGGMRIFIADNSQNNNRFNVAITEVALTTVPEPGSFLLMGFGLLGACLWRRGRR